MIDISDLFKTSSGQQMKWKLNFLINKCNFKDLHCYQGLIIINYKKSVIYSDMLNSYNSDIIKKYVNIFESLIDKKILKKYKINYLSIDFEKYTISLHSLNKSFMIITIFDFDVNKIVEKFKANQLIDLIQKDFLQYK